MLLTGDVIDAKEAERIGLVNRVVPREKLKEATTELAEKLANKSPIALQWGKRSFYTMSEMEYLRAAKYLREISCALGNTEDAREGLKAFLEKGTPQWKGR